MVTGEEAIATLLTSYQDALRQSDADAVTRLFTTDRVLMAQEGSSTVGADPVPQAYGAIFDNVALDICFDIAEVRPLAAEWAFARTTSTGTIEVKATGARLPGQSGNLHLSEVDGTWKIARYCFCTTKPPRGKRG